MKIMGIILIVLGIVAAYPSVGPLPESIEPGTAISWAMAIPSGFFAILTGIGFLLSPSSK